MAHDPKAPAAKPAEPLTPARTVKVVALKLGVDSAGGRVRPGQVFAHTIPAGGKLGSWMREVDAETPVDAPPPPPAGTAAAANAASPASSSVI